METNTHPTRRERALAACLSIEQQLGVTADRVRRIVDAANALLRENYTVLFLDPDAQCVKPILIVASEPRLWNMVTNDEACYYRSGSDNFGPYRIGQFCLGGAIVRWVERGN